MNVCFGGIDLAIWLHEHFSFPVLLSMGVVYALEFALFFCLAGWIIPKIRWPRMSNRHASGLATALVWTLSMWLLLMSFFTVCEHLERRARLAWEAEQAAVQPW